MAYFYIQASGLFLFLIQATGDSPMWEEDEEDCYDWEMCDFYSVLLCDHSHSSNLDVFFNLHRELGKAVNALLIFFVGTGLSLYCSGL